MSKVTSYPPGTFCWVDLTTPDQVKAKDFYSKLFKWDAEDISVPFVDGEVYYSMMRLREQAVAAIAPQPPFMKNAPSMWNSYVSVENVDIATAKAKQLGAKVLMKPGDVNGSGRMAAIVDPGGAQLMLWQANKRPGAELINEPGSLLWNELWVRDINLAEKFYHQLFGWTMHVQTLPSGEPYRMFQNHGRDAGALMQISPVMGTMAPMWVVYFSVTDFNEFLANAEKLGAQHNMEPINVPGTGSFVMLTDPVGAYFYIIQIDREPLPLTQDA